MTVVTDERRSQTHSQVLASKPDPPSSLNKGEPEISLLVPLNKGDLGGSSLSDKYRSAILKVLKNHQGDPQGEVRSELVADREHDHYQLVNVGWQGERRVYGCVLHLDIMNDKIWIQHNGTEFDIANELVEAGIDKQSIVIGFHSPVKRQFTEFAIC